MPRRSTPSAAGTPPAAWPEVRVALTRREFRYFNWVLAFERPTLRFLLMTFVLLSLASLLGVWAVGRVFALAALVPTLGYVVWLITTTNALWRRHPEIGAERTYRFREESYTVTGSAAEEVAWNDLARAIEARPAFYLMRRNGLADLLPKRALPDSAAFAAELRRRVREVSRSSYL
jgi:hypothetical protein